MTRRSGLKHPFFKSGALLNKNRTPEHSVLSLPITRQLHVYGWDFENELRTFSFLPSSSFPRLLQSSRLSFSISFTLSFAPHRRDLHTNTTHRFRVTSSERRRRVQQENSHFENKFVLRGKTHTHTHTHGIWERIVNCHQSETF